MGRRGGGVGRRGREEEVGRKGREGWKGEGGDGGTEERRKGVCERNYGEDAEFLVWRLECSQFISGEFVYLPHCYPVCADLQDRCQCDHRPVEALALKP